MPSATLRLRGYRPKTYPLEEAESSRLKEKKQDNFRHCYKENKTGSGARVRVEDQGRPPESRDVNKAAQEWASGVTALEAEVRAKKQAQGMERGLVRLVHKGSGGKKEKEERNAGAKSSGASWQGVWILLNVMRHLQDVCVCEHTRHSICHFKIYSSVTYIHTVVLEGFLSTGVKLSDRSLRKFRKV